MGKDDTNFNNNLTKQFLLQNGFVSGCCPESYIKIGKISVEFYVCPSAYGCWSGILYDEKFNVLHYDDRIWTILQYEDFMQLARTYNK